MASIRFFRHYIRLPFLLLALIEALIFLAAVYGGAHMRFFGDTAAVVSSIGSLMPRAMIFAPVMIMSMIAMGLYQARLRETFTGILLRIMTSFLIGVSVLALIFYLFPSIFLGRGALVLTLIISFLGISLTRAGFYLLSSRDKLKRRVLVLGTGERANSLSQLRRQADQRGFYITGYVHITGEHDLVDPDKVLHLDSDLAEYALEQEIDEIVVAVTDRRKQFPLHALLDCRMSGIGVIDLLTFFERESGKVRLDLLHPSWLIFSDGFQQNTLREYSKRLFDIGAGLLLLLLTWPVMFVTAVLIFIEGGWKGPVLYLQTRVGFNGEPFVVLKFRSMRPDAEQDGEARWAQENDDRITRVGAFIRRYRIDELPQIFNVLRGEMSFVGPRPERPEFVNQFSERIPYYSERHRVKPGLTGWAQLGYPYGASEKDAIEKLQFDLYYIKNHSMFLDLAILLQTTEVVLWRKGAR